MKRAVLSVGLLALGMAAPALAAPARSPQGFALESAWPLPIEAQLRVTSALSGIPPTGYVPLRVEIKNNDQQSHSYSVEVEIGASYSRANTRIDRHVFEVAAGQTSQFEVLAAVPTSGQAGLGWCNVKATVSGGRLGRRTARRSGRVPGPKDKARAVIALGAHLPAPSDAFIESVKGKLHVLQLEAAVMPVDWRGLLGLDAIWLSTVELAQMSAQARRALVTWVAQGGAFVLLGPEADLRPRSLAFTDAQWRSGRFALGRLYTIASESVPGQSLTDTMDSQAAMEVVAKLGVRAHALSKPGTLQKEVAPIEVARAQIILLLAALALLIGPVNIFIIAPRRHRVRLLWSTPLLSVGASALLIIFILLQDGVGGQGQRTQFVLRLADLHMEHRMQIQASRTGVVPWGRFSLPDDVHIDALSTGGGQRPEQARTLRRGPGRVWGDWYQTRATQAELLHAAVPSRARILVQAGAQPALTSNVPEGLSQVFYADPQGQVWFTEQLQPGATELLEPAESKQMHEMLTEAASAFPGDMRQAIGAQWPLRGWMLAQVQSGLQPWTTLKSIEWADRPSFLLMEVSVSE